MEQAEKWTPGPWRAEQVWRPPIGNVYKPALPETDSMGNIFWGYSISGCGDNGAPVLPTLAAVHNFPNNIHANAHLIAAAPRMAEYIIKRANEGDADAAAIVATIL